MFGAEFIEEVARPEPDYDKLRRLIIEAYNAQHGTAIPFDVDHHSTEARGVLSWVVRNTEHVQHLLVRRSPTLIPVFSPSLFAKVFCIAQYHCPFCSKEFPMSTIPIRVPPHSFQAATPRTKAAFKKAIAHRFARRPTPFEAFASEKRLCVQLIFVVDRKRPDKDVDNMAKLLSDSLQGITYVNDRQIDHLSVMKIRHAGDEEWIKINLRPSRLNDHDDVLFNVVNCTWDSDPLDLDQFLDPPRPNSP